ncbi:hypothetical protein IQ266_15315 [filamentous cyanobacterium LEGE 11480]|uniref:Uncharacterized protein n=1 Tax=Romeriopsis navalis LEGE 11480 TaxID=2777977 RepID=A0A928VNV3_9CYAN|nr:hypothetical protein [Romeriopsis navalis]MBE9031103.1 hypothetical protein [Romeriopsis navalis LEGE 11480]
MNEYEFRRTIQSMRKRLQRIGYRIDDVIAAAPVAALTNLDELQQQQALLNTYLTHLEQQLPTQFTGEAFGQFH